MEHQPLSLLIFAGYGAIGAFIGAISKTRKLELPRIIRRGVSLADRVTLIDVGFLGAPLLGAVLAAIVDGRPQTAIAYGIAAGFAGPAVINSVIDPILARIGMEDMNTSRQEGERKP